MMHETTAKSQYAGWQFGFNLADEWSYSQSDQRQRFIVTGRWLYKLDLRIAKDVRVGRMKLQGLVEAFNLRNTFNPTNDNGVFGSRTYLQPANTTDTFYQPRQVQFGFRVSY